MALQKKQRLILLFVILITEGLKKKEDFLLSVVEMVMENYPKASFEFNVTGAIPQYERNFGSTSAGSGLCKRSN